VRSVENLVNLYFTSVGRNGKLLLNVPPTPAGLLHSTDVERLIGMRRALDTMFAAERTVQFDQRSWEITGPRSAVHTVTLRQAAPIGIVRLEEDIRRGQVVASYRVEGDAGDGMWKELSRGTTIGYTKLDRFPAASAKRLRVTIEDAVAESEPIVMRAYQG
jgi:alpha-L-fucosidase